MINDHQLSSSPSIICKSEDALTLLCLACHYSHHLFKCFQNVSNVSKQPNESKHRKVTAAGNEMQLGVKLRSFWMVADSSGKKRSGSSDNFSPSGSIWGGRLKVFGRQFDGIKAWHSYLRPHQPIVWEQLACTGWDEPWLILSENYTKIESRPEQQPTQPPAGWRRKCAPKFSSLEHTWAANESVSLISRIMRTGSACLWEVHTVWP